MSMSMKFEVVPLAEVPKEHVDVVYREDSPVVLVVDDDPIIADTVSKILSKSGFATLTAYDGISALELAKQFRPQLLISDVEMPRMTGVETAIAVTEMNPECKVLLFCWQAATVDLLEKAREDGYDFSILDKPIHPTQLLRRVSECLETVAVD